jgi:hypothetical protein
MVSLSHGDVVGIVEFWDSWRGTRTVLSAVIEQVAAIIQ